MEAATIERVEELRYLISRDTHTLLKARKRTGSGNGEVKQLEKSLADMKREYETSMSRIKAEGFYYALMNEKEIDALHGKFMLLQQNDKMDALAGEGTGAQLIDQMDDILKTNAESKRAIAAFLTDLNLLIPRAERERVKKFFEGYLDSAIFQIAEGADKLSVDLFVQASMDLDFACDIKGNVCELRRRSGMRVPSFDISSLGKFGKMLTERVALPNFGFFGRSEGIEEGDEETETKGVEKKVEKIEAKKETKQAQQLQPKEQRQQAQKAIQPAPQTPTTPAQQTQTAPVPKPEIQSASTSQSSQQLLLQSENDEKIEEIDKKMAVILKNGKMQRWVLGTFKDDSERQEYEKAQTILANLMKMKRDIQKKR